MKKTEKSHRNIIEDVFKFVPEGLLVFTNKFKLYKKNKAFQDIAKKYAERLNYTEEELENIIIEQVKSRITNKDKTEIRISKKKLLYKLR